VSATSVLVRKELLESWRTMRLPIVGGLFLVVGLTSPLLARFLPEIIKAAAGDQLPTIPVPTPVAAQTYTVAPGDNLFRISLRFNVPLDALMRANGITNSNLIYVGQVLRIP